MKILIHVCCADCGLKLIESIKDNFDEVVIYFYNPNIHPRSEYFARLKALQLVFEKEKIKLIIPDWQPKDYFKAINPSKSPFDKGDFKRHSRCIECWKIRLKKTAEYAKINGFEYFSSTLLSSQYQNSNMIEKIGEEIAKDFNIKFLIPKRIDKNLKTKGFYKQIFCGCVYSLKERLEEKYL